MNIVGIYQCATVAFTIRGGVDKQCSLVISVGEIGYLFFTNMDNNLLAAPCVYVCACVCACVRASPYKMVMVFMYQHSAFYTTSYNKKVKRPK